MQFVYKIMFEGCVITLSGLCVSEFEKIDYKVDLLFFFLAFGGVTNENS